jgi:hypothetical protein
MLYRVYNFNEIRGLGEGGRGTLQKLGTPSNLLSPFPFDIIALCELNSARRRWFLTRFLIIQLCDTT